MSDYCLFTVEHLNARRIYVRGVADITEPVDEYEKIIKFYHGSELKAELPPNPYEKGENEFELYEELINLIKSEFEDFGDELVFADEFEIFNTKFHLETEKVII